MKVALVGCGKTADMHISGKPEQRISYQNSPRKPSPPSGFDSPSIRNVKANARRSCCKWSRGECYCPTWLTPDCLPSGQFHRREGLSLPLRLIFFPKVCLEQFAGSPHAFLRHHNRFCFAPRVRDVAFGMEPIHCIPVVGFPRAPAGSVIERRQKEQGQHPSRPLYLRCIPWLEA